MRRACGRGRPRWSRRPARSSVMRPSFITRMRWQVARSSGRSSEMTSTPSPRPARSRMMPWISAFEPTSTPTVGPFSTSTRGPRASQRASTTRCWLPPESERTGAAGSGALTASRRSQSSASPQSPRRSRSGPRACASSRADADVAQRSTGSGTAPRSAGPRARSRCPPPPRRAGRRAAPRGRRSSRCPASGATRPKSALASAVRPEPSRPEMPSTSPACRSKPMSSKAPAFESPRTSSRRGAPAASGAGGVSATSRPVMCRVSEAASNSAAGPSATLRPLRSTTTCSQTSEHLGELVADEEHRHAVAPSAGG